MCVCVCVRVWWVPPEELQQSALYPTGGKIHLKELGGLLEWMVPVAELQRRAARKEKIKLNVILHNQDTQEEDVLGYVMLMLRSTTQGVASLIPHTHTQTHTNVMRMSLELEPSSPDLHVQSSDEMHDSSLSVVPLLFVCVWFFTVNAYMYLCMGGCVCLCMFMYP